MKTWKSVVWWGVFAWLATSVAQAATVTVSPSGTVGDAGRVAILATINHGNGAQIQSLSATLNGVNVSQYFLSYATVSTSGTTTTASIGVPLGAGTYTFALTAQVFGEGSAAGATTFTVQGDDQTRRRNMVVSRINEWMHQWDALQFPRFINMGNIATFRNRFSEPEVQVFVDAATLNSMQAVAAYMDSWIFPFYWRDLVLAVEPEQFSVTGATHGSGTLWHEGIHAISGGTGGFGVDDHILIGWAEACVRGFAWLESLERHAATNSYRDDPTVAAEARTRWNKFVQTCETGSVYGRAPTAAERATFSTQTGISIDAKMIKAGYRSLGYPASYFDNVQVTVTSPASGTQVAENQVRVTARVALSDTATQVSTAGIVVNGAAQLAPVTMSGTTGTFEGVAVLKTGDNDIYAGVVTNTGDVFTSPSINVKSNALLNTYHVRITWDKNDTDVDLHFAWSGGSECYYSNKAPTWGGNPATSPRLDVDDRDGFGPENITIDQLPGSGHYKIYVHYYSDHGKGPTTVNATIYKNGSPIFSRSQSMSNGQNWTLLEFDV